MENELKVRNSVGEHSTQETGGGELTQHNGGRS